VLQVRVDLALSRSKNAELEAESASLKEQLVAAAATAEQLQAVQTELQAVQQQLSSKDEQLTAATAESDTLRVQVLGLEEKLQGLEGAAGQGEQLLVQYKRSVEELESHKQQLLSQIAAAAAAKESAASKVSGCV
jgi:chromosome segregation ATPase